MLCSRIFLGRVSSRWVAYRCWNIMKNANTHSLQWEDRNREGWGRARQSEKEKKGKVQYFLWRHLRSERIHSRVTFQFPLSTESCCHLALCWWSYRSCNTGTKETVECSDDLDVFLDVKYMSHFRGSTNTDLPPGAMFCFKLCKFHFRNWETKAIMTVLAPIPMTLLGTAPSWTTILAN